MKKSLLFTLIFVLSGIFAQPAFYGYAEENHDAFETQAVDPERGREKICAYLEESVFQSRGQGQIAAAYHAFGQDGNEQYLWAYIAQFSRKKGKVRLSKARSGPLVLMISKDGAIQGHWEPEPGENYTKSIQDRFPPEYHDDVLHFQSEHEDILRKLKKSVRRNAAKQELAEHLSDLILTIGAIEIVKCDANRTTGYRWYYHVADPEVADIIFDTYLLLEPEKDVLGAGGKRVFGIKGYQKGMTMIELRYAREWNPQKVDKTLKIRLKDGKTQKGDPDQPNILATKYIDDHNWEIHSYSTKEAYPSEFSLSDGTVSCLERDDHSDRDLIEKTIDGRDYCLRISSEGSAGSTYTTYTYATARKTTLLTLSLTLRYPNCDAYSEPVRIECKREKENMNLDSIVDYIFDETSDSSTSFEKTIKNDFSD